jgi:hypothetical protein
MAEPTKSLRVEYDREVAQAGIDLLDVAPLIFQDHIMLLELKRHRDELRDAVMARFWRDNGPWALSRSCKLKNAEVYYIPCCRDCTPDPTRINHRFWGQLLSIVTACGLSYVVLSTINNAVTFTTNFTDPDAADITAYPKPADFNELIACKHMAPVSHIDVHIVFQHVGRVLGIVYGRKLWEVKDLGSDEIRKLDMLFARLHASKH